MLLFPYPNEVGPLSVRALQDFGKTKIFIPDQSRLPVLSKEVCVFCANK
jgi:hypothetical protein